MKKLTTLILVFMSLMLVNQSANALVYTVKVPDGTNACYITGEMNGWNPGSLKMTKVDDNTYTIDLPDAKETQKYQYLSGPDWKYIEKDENGDAIEDRTWSELDVVAQWLETFKLDAREVTIEALVPVEVKELYLVGSFNGWKSPSEEFKMTFVEELVDGKIFTINVFSEDAINMEFKFVAGPAWAYEQTDPTDNYVFGTTENTVSVVVNAFKEYFDPEKTGTINIKVNVPAGTSKVYLQGDHLGWDMKKAVEGVDNGDGTFSFSVPMVMSISYRMYNKPDWGYPEVDEEGKERANREASYPEDANTEITVIGWKNVDTAVSKVEEATNKIYISNNILTIEDVKSSVEIYDVSGRMIQSATVSGTFSSDYLNKGFYIVKIDNASTKTLIK